LHGQQTVKGDRSLRRHEAAVRPELSFRLCRDVDDLFPESSHVRLFGLSETTDYSLVRRKVTWLRAGNQSTMKILALLRRHAALIAAFEQEEDAVCLELS
jgi:predicted nuclease of predicted toxin-antitoxin system